MPRPKKEPKKPVETPLVKEIKNQIIAGEIVNRKGDALTPIGPDKLRLMQADVMSAIVRRFDANKIADLLDELTQANSVTAAGREIADNRIRLSAVTLILAYALGRPVEKAEVLNINLGADTAHNLKERLQGSPALRAAFRSILEQSEEAAGEAESKALPAPTRVKDLPPMKQAKKSPGRPRKAKTITIKDSIEFED